MGRVMTQGEHRRFDINPSLDRRVVVLIGIPHGLCLAHRRYLGMAGLAISRDLLPQYLLMPLVDLPRLRPATWRGVQHVASRRAADLHAR